MVHIESMLPDLYPLQQIIIHHFSVLLMDGKNLITEVQELWFLSVFQILDNAQVLLHQNCLCMFLLRSFDAALY